MCLDYDLSQWDCGAAWDCVPSAGSYACAYTDAYSNPDAHAHAYSDTCANSYSDSYPNTYAYPCCQVPGDLPA